MTYRDKSIAKKWAGLLLGSLLLLLAFWLSLVYGSVTTGWKDAYMAITHYDESVQNHLIVRTSRMPRAFFAVAVGASLAVAGAVMQAVTRNPLASPSILGVNAGAAFFVVFAITVLSIGHLGTLLWIAFSGAAMATVCVYLLGSLGRDGLTPLKIVLAGAAMSALFLSFTQGLLVSNETALQDVLFWLAGSIANRPVDMLYRVLPYMGLALFGAWALARHLNILASGEETAVGLGQRTAVVKAVAAAVIVLSAGSSVAVAGPIGFVGIVIPHIARYFTGSDHRWLIPYCAILGAALLLLADVAARLALRPEEVPIGVMTAVIGTPFFVYIARRGKRST